MSFNAFCEYKILLKGSELTVFYNGITYSPISNKHLIFHSGFKAKTIFRECKYFSAEKLFEFIFAYIILS